jgi:hypothetical protein
MIYTASRAAPKRCLGRRGNPTYRENFNPPLCLRALVVHKTPRPHTPKNGKNTTKTLRHKAFFLVYCRVICLIVPIISGTSQPIVRRSLAPREKRAEPQNPSPSSCLCALVVLEFPYVSLLTMTPFRPKVSILSATHACPRHSCESRNPEAFGQAPLLSPH